jgi:cytochrome c oxidase subunit 3
MPTDRGAAGRQPFDDDDDDRGNESDRDRDPARRREPATGDDFEREPSFRNRGTLGMILFLAALSVLFGASLFLFAFMRARAAAGPADPAAARGAALVRVPWGTLEFPNLLFLSTILVLGVSTALALATKQIKSGRHLAYRRALTAALAMAVGFLTFQAPAMARLLLDHRGQLAGKGTHLYGLIFFLVLVHALHVIGGMVTLSWVTVRAHRGHYDRLPPHHDPIRHTTLYWHFLDGVWVVMFLMLYFMR